VAEICDLFISSENSILNIQDLWENMAIVLDGISKSYKEGGVERLILSDVYAEIPAGAFSVFIGKSGTGKSTLLNLIGGLDTPDKGTIRIGNILLKNLSDYQRTIFRRKTIGFVFQFFNLIPTLTVLENVSLIQELDGKNSKTTGQVARDILEQVGLKNRLQTMPDRLSGGEQQRVAVARALAHDPAIILADEPTGNLDQETGSTILKLMLRLCREKEKTLIVATHSNEALSQADYVFSIKDQKVQREPSVNPLT